MSKKIRFWWRTLKKLPQAFQHIKTNKNNKFNSVNLYFQDEGRYGLMTRLKRVLTIKGVKPVCPYQHRFKNTWPHGCFSPIDGNSFMLEIENVDAQIFQIFIREFSKQRPDELKILVMDNAAFHTAAAVKYPDNIMPIYIPPYSPELNPAEKIWQFLKDKMSMKIYEDIKALRKDLFSIINQQLTSDRIKSLTGYQLYLDNFNACF